MSKSLLPVANIPLFWYSLNMLSRNNIKDVILVTNERCHSEIKNLLNDHSFPSIPNLSIEVICIDSKIDEDADEWGTADVLRHIQPKLKKDRDLLIVSGDVVSDISLTKMLSFHCKNNSMVTCLLSDSIINGPVPGPKERLKKYRDFVALIPDTNQLLFLSEEEDFGEAQEFNGNLFKKYPKVSFTSKYKDIHIYVMKQSAVEILKSHKNFSSIKADLISYLLRTQYSNKSGPELLNSLPNAACKCFAYVCSTEDDASLIARCNNVAVYFETNRAVQKILNKLHPGNVQKSREDLKSSSVNAIESQISVSGKIGEKTIFKKSVIGDNCSIGSGVKIESSLLMNDVVVKDGAVIKNSILFPNVEVGEKADLGMCIVSTGQTIGNKEKIVNQIVSPEKEMAIDENDFAPQILPMLL
uniref:Translation initiation factor eIF2B subunit gamma n=1 Tax=Ditylenchus dipsaci TaxID=166011 RepID=A0A915EHR9_9BILA